MKTVLDLGVVGLSLLMMATVGMELEPDAFRRLARRRGLLAGTLLLPAALLPVLGFALARALALPPHLTAGLLLLAACPVGDIVNVYTLLARGNLALSVSVNTLSCLLSVVTMAFAFALYDHLLGQSYAFSLPTSALVLRLTLMVGLPVLAGMAARRWRPAWVAAHRVILRNICLVGVAFLLVYVLASRWAQVVVGWRQTALAGVAFMAAALAAGLALARWLRLNASDSVTVITIFAVRNVGLALAIAVTLMDRIEFSEVAAVYFLAEVPLLLAVVYVYRRGWAPTPLGGEAAGA